MGFGVGLGLGVLGLRLAVQEAVAAQLDHGVHLAIDLDKARHARAVEGAL